jgi:hypothetical protein
MGGANTTIPNGRFSNPNSFYRVVHGQDAFDDILKTGVIRSVTPESKPSPIGKIDLGARPTAFPSFSKGSASMSYAQQNPSHFIIETQDPSIKQSTLGRHGKGSTYFPTDKEGNYINELDSKKTKVYKHVGNNKYELALEPERPISGNPLKMISNLKIANKLAAPVALYNMANESYDLYKNPEKIQQNLDSANDRGFFSNALKGVTNPVTSLVSFGKGVADLAQQEIATNQTKNEEIRLGKILEKKQQKYNPSKNLYGRDALVLDKKMSYLDQIEQGLKDAAK